MELINPDIGLIIWTTFVFIILLFLLTKFAWKPVMKALHDREKSIKDSLDAAAKAREEMEQLKAENDKILQEARAERDSLIADAQKSAKEIVEEAKNNASTEGERMIQKAKTSIEGEKKAALEEMKNLASDLSVEIAERLLRRELKDKNAQEELINEYLKEADITTI